MGRLSSKIVLLTGGASGIGAGIAARFVSEDCSLCLCDIDQKRGTELAQKLGPNAVFFDLDVTSPDQWADVTGQIVDRFGRIDVLVNNAGAASGIQRLDREAPSDFERIMRLNVDGVWHGIRAVMPGMSKNPGGSIVNIASIDSYVGVAGMTTYVASKFAVLGITKSAALELGDLGIRVNAVHPGITDTPAVAALPAEFRSQLHAAVARQPIKRLGTPGDVASAALFFASDESAYCTGSSLLVDGGQIAGRYRELPNA